MPDFTDQTGRLVHLNKIPSKIISVVPSQTELLYSLGLEEEVTGITKFCVRPDKWQKSKTKVGGTKTLNLSIIQQLEPDLVIANKEENLKEQIEAIAGSFPVWISDVNNLDSTYQMITEIGTLVNKTEAAIALADSIQTDFKKLKPPATKLKTIYLIWRNPYMTVGGDTFIHAMLCEAGFENIFKNSTRYPTVSIEQLQQQNPELILLSSEPFPFKEKHVQELKSFLPNTKILLVDGESFSWYGSRLLKTPGYLNSLYKLL